MHNLITVGALLCVPVGSSWSAPAIDTTGINRLSPAVAKDACLDIIDAGRPIVRECDDSGPDQQWKLTSINGGYYRLTTQGRGGKCLDIVNDGKANNQTTLADCAEASGQHWKLTPVEGGYVALTTEWRGANQCLALSKQRLVLTACANKPEQHWRLSKLAAAVAPVANNAVSRGTLNDEQEKAKTEFTDAMKDDLQKFKKLCGVDLTLTSDFENYSAATWKAQGGGRSRHVGDNCAAMVGVLRRSCKNPDYSDRPSGKPPKATRVACVFAGYKPKRDGDTDQDHFQDNMSFKDGLLTINNAASLYNVEQYTTTILFHPGGLSSTGRNGTTCTSSSACHSNNCNTGTCQACSSKVRCVARGDECSSDSDGVCLTPLTPEQTERRREREESSRPEPRRGPKKRGLGEMCKSTAECEGKRICTPQNKTRSVCE